MWLFETASAQNLAFQTEAAAGHCLSRQTNRRRIPKILLFANYCLLGSILLQIARVCSYGLPATDCSHDCRSSFKQTDPEQEPVGWSSSIRAMMLLCSEDETLVSRICPTHYNIVERRNANSHGPNTSSNGSFT